MIVFEMRLVLILNALHHSIVLLEFVVLNVVVVLQIDNHQYRKYHFHNDFLWINLMLFVMDHQMMKNEEYLVDEDLLEMELCLILHRKIIFLCQLYVLPVKEVDEMLTEKIHTMIN
jgi:hypothetical protein